MQIEMRDIASVTPYDKNPRRNEKAVDSVMNSIQDFGFKVPIVVDSTGVIINGHTRLKAAQKLGLKQVPVVVAADLTPEKARAYRLVDNKVAEIASWDEDILRQELEELQKSWSDTSSILEYGFKDDLFADFDATFEPEKAPTPAKLRAKQGDLWALGNHRLIVGDSTDIATIKRLMGGKTADLLQTDPPYGVDYQGFEQSREQLANDGLTDKEFINFLTTALKAADKVLKQGGAFYIWHAGNKVRQNLQALDKVGWSNKSTLVWVKDHASFMRADYHTAYEPCLYGWKEGAAHYFTFDRTQTNAISEDDINKMTRPQLINALRRMLHDGTDVFYEQRPVKSELHPTQKPVGLIMRQIANSTKRGENVLDLFAGSGTTLIACERLGRRAFCAELDPGYATSIITRWENETKQKAVKL
jgi:site-specific DNA-methyltransferase (adenine-specific)